MSRRSLQPRVKRLPLVILTLSSALATGLAEGVVQGAIAFVLEQVLGLTVESKLLPLLTSLIALLLVGAIAAFVYSIDSFAQWLSQVLSTRTAAAIPPTVKELEDPFQGLITFVGKQCGSKPTSAEAAIERHLMLVDPPQLKHCWLICTQDTLSVARTIQQKLSNEGKLAYLKLYFEPIEQVPDPDQPGQTLSLVVQDTELNNPEYMKRLVNGIYLHAQTLGLSESDVVADFTGGPKTLTAGIILACIQPGRRMEYFSQLQAEQDAKTDLKEIWLEYDLKAEG
ncbi:MAG: hypothetical protein ACPGVO_16965 [Spirulinaceae cyanobacterium]